MEEQEYTICHSLPCQETIKKMIAKHYQLQLKDSLLIKSGISDTYQLITKEKNYILKIYKKDWRKIEEILFEMEMLLHLKARGIPVAEPIPTKNSQHFFEVDAPEGKRYAVVFAFCSGQSLYELVPFDAALAQKYGQITAKVHQSMDDFRPQYPRFSIDRKRLLDEPAALANQLFARHPQVHFLKEAEDKIGGKLEGLRREDFDFGIIHGDVDPGNVHFTADGQISIFDFDLCAYGWRAWDLTVFLWECRWSKWGDKIAAAFLRGYKSTRTLRDKDQDLIPWLMPLRGIWYLGLLAKNKNSWGGARIKNSYFIDKEFEFLKKLLDEL